MTRFSFPYARESSKAFGEILRPVVELYVKTRSGAWLTIFPYADSGADISLFPKKVAEIVGLKLEDGRGTTITGVGGEQITIYIHQIRMKIGDAEFKARVGFTDREDIPYLLGRTDILKHFTVIFDEKQTAFIAKRRNHPSSSDI